MLKPQLAIRPSFFTHLGRPLLPRHLRPTLAFTPYSTDRQPDGSPPSSSYVHPKVQKSSTYSQNQPSHSQTAWDRFQDRIKHRLPTFPAFLGAASLITSLIYLQYSSSQNVERNRDQQRRMDAAKEKIYEDTGLHPDDSIELHGLRFPKVKPEDSPFTLDNCTVVFVLGGPGAGKGTQSARLAKEFNYVHLSAGDLLREEQTRPGSPYADLINWFIREGKIVPFEVTITLLREAMKRSGSNKFLVDGFPRTLPQGEEFEKAVCPARLVINFEANEEVLESRLLKRGETSGRADDNIESIKKRFRTFVMSTYPVITHYMQADKCITIDSSRPVDEVYADARRIFSKLEHAHPTEKPKVEVPAAAS